MAIYFYLHLQYNGWFSLALIGFLLRGMEEAGIRYSAKRAKTAFHLYAWSLGPAFLLSILWYGLGTGVTIIAVAAGLLQLAAAAYVLLLLWGREALPQLFGSGRTRRLALLSLAALGVKVVLELGSAIPVLSPLIYGTRSVVIGYLHLVLLGFVSFLLLALLMRRGWLGSLGRRGAAGETLFAAGFLLNELTLFLQALLGWTGWRGGVLPGALPLLLAASAMLAAGILLLAFARKEETRWTVTNRAAAPVHPTASVS